MVNGSVESGRHEGSENHGLCSPKYHIVEIRNTVL